MDKSIAVVKQHRLDPEFRDWDTEELRIFQARANEKFHKMLKEIDELKHISVKYSTELYNRAVLRGEGITPEMYWSSR